MYVSLLQLRRSHPSRRYSHIKPTRSFRLVLSVPKLQYLSILSIRQIWLLLAAPVLLLYQIPLHQIQVFLLTRVHLPKLPYRFQARPESLPPPTARPVDSPSTVLCKGPTFPTLRARSNGESLYPSDSPSRSPSPDAEQLISSLANYQNLSDDALYDITLKAQQAMVKWQIEYKTLQKDINRMSKPSKTSKAKTKTKPCELFEEPVKPAEMHHDSPHYSGPQVTQTTATNPFK